MCSVRVVGVYKVRLIWWRRCPRRSAAATGASIRFRCPNTASRSRVGPAHAFPQTVVIVAVLHTCKQPECVMIQPSGQTLLIFFRYYLVHRNCERWRNYGCRLLQNGLMPRKETHWADTFVSPQDTECWYTLYGTEPNQIMDAPLSFR